MSWTISNGNLHEKIYRYFILLFSPLLGYFIRLFQSSIENNCLDGCCWALDTILWHCHCNWWGAVNVNSTIKWWSKTKQKLVSWCIHAPPSPCPGAGAAAAWLLPPAGLLLAAGGSSGSLETKAASEPPATFSQSQRRPLHYAKRASTHSK